jgi:hypothetical protein
MQIRNGIETEAINHLGKAIGSVYHLGKLVWEYITSCFGYGCWLNDYPWDNNDAWNNG